MTYARVQRHDRIQLGFPGEYTCPEGQELDPATGDCIESGASIYTVDGPFCPPGKYLKIEDMSCTDIPGVAILGGQKQLPKNPNDRPNVAAPGEWGETPTCGARAVWDGLQCVCEDGTAPAGGDSPDCVPEAASPATPAAVARSHPANPVAVTPAAAPAPSGANDSTVRTAAIAAGVGGVAVLAIAAALYWSK